MGMKAPVIFIVVRCRGPFMPLKESGYKEQNKSYVLYSPFPTYCNYINEV